MKLLMTALVSFLLGICITVSVTGDSQAPHKSDPRPTPTPQKIGGGMPEILHEGYIRSINWERREFIYESSFGYVKVIGPVCGNSMLPVWDRMHVYQLNFHWDQPDGAEFGCFDLDYIGHQAGVPGE